MLSLDAIVSTYDFTGVVDAIGVFSQWAIFIIKILLMLFVGYAVAVTIPGFMMVMAFSLIDFMLLDKLTNFLISGNWNSMDKIVVTPNSPLMVMLYIGLIFAFVFFVVFLINYFVRNAANVSPARYVKKTVLILGIPFFILATPFVFLTISIFIKLITGSLLNIFQKSTTFNPVFTTGVLDKNLQFLLGVPNFLEINSESWNQAWSGVVMTPELENIKNSLFNSFNSLASFMSKYDYASWIIQLTNAKGDLTKLQQIFSEMNLKDLQILSSKWLTFNVALKQLFNSNLNEMQISTITNLFSVFNNTDFVSQAIQNNNSLYAQSVLISNMSLDSTGQMAQTTNFAYDIFYLISGIPTNTINGVLATAGGLGWITMLGQPLQILFVIFIGSATMAGLARGIFRYISTFVYRWYWIFRSIPVGAVAVARTANENSMDDSLLRIWFRETLTVFLSLFVSAMSFMTFMYISSIIFDSIPKVNTYGSINTAQSLVINVVLLLFVIILLYCSLTANDKILDTFNKSKTFNDVASNQVMKEYNSAKQIRNNTSQNISARSANASKSIERTAKGVKKISKLKRKK